MRLLRSSGFLLILLSCNLLGQVPYQPLFQKYDGSAWIARAAQCEAESRFNPNAISYVHGKPCAYGLAQFTLPTWKTWGKPAGASPLEPEPAIDANGRYMNWLLGRVSDHQLDTSLGAYNAGLGSIQKAQRLAEQLGIPGSQGWLRALPQVTGAQNAKQTSDYIIRNRKYRKEIQRQK